MVKLQRVVDKIQLESYENLDRVTLQRVVEKVQLASNENGA